jgi:hypothetical protein
MRITKRNFELEDRLLNNEYRIKNVEFRTAFIIRYSSSLTLFSRTLTPLGKYFRSPKSCNKNDL